MLQPRHFAFSLSAIVLAAMPGPASAQPAPGLYIGAGAGVNFAPRSTQLSDRKLAGELRALGVGTTLSTGSETGFVGVLSVGYAYGNGLRAEIEGNFRQNEIGRSNAPNTTTSGTGRSYGVMANAFYDIRIAAAPWVVPYVGGGIGYLWRQADGLTAVDRALGGTFTSSDTRGGFAWQAIGGAAFPIAAVPGLSVTAEYRYIASNPEYFDVRVSNTRTGATAASGAGKQTFENHSVLLGLRYSLGTPRPVAPIIVPAAAAPSPARTFLVFFDWDRADLTDRARQIIAEAATNARTMSSTRIEVSGHADRTGSASYNQRLSVRRGEAVAAELVRRGLTRNQITIQGFGFDRPLVPTAMGVREPQNRRVEIVLR